MAQETQQERLRDATAMRDAILLFQLKLGQIKNDMPIESQIEYLSNYNDLPKKEEASNDTVDSYRLDFQNSLFNQYFKKYPETRELLGEKKTDNDQADFTQLCLMDFLLSGTDEKEMDISHVKAYNKITLDYRDFLVNYIISNEKWQLTTNSIESFKLYSDIKNSFVDIIKNYKGGLTIDETIRDVNNRLVDQVIQLKQMGFDEKSFATLVTEVILSPYKIFNHLVGQMSKGGADILAIFFNHQGAFEEYSVKQIYDSVNSIKSKGILNETQSEVLDETQEIIQSLDAMGVTSATGSATGSKGCLGFLMLLAIPLSALLLLF